MGTTAYEPGSVVDVEEDIAKNLIETGAAVKGVIETAAAPPPENTGGPTPAENTEHKPGGKEVRGGKK